VTRHSIWAGILAVALAGPAWAQEQATVVKRDGSKVSGRFEAWNRNTNTLYIRVSVGDQQVIPLGNAAVIDAEGNGTSLPPTETGPASGPDHVLILKTGEVIRGRLINIEGGEGSGEENQPRMVTFKPNDAGERQVPFKDVRRIYLGSFPSSLSESPPAAATPAPEQPQAAAVAQPAPGSVNVPANVRWVATNLTVRRSDRIAFTTEGQVQLSTDPEDKAVSAGSLKGRTPGAGAPEPTLLAGALLGRVGTGAPFAIGDQTQPLPMPGDGPLFLGVNDDEVSDNQGAFAVTMRITRGRR
jgi:hypothetical protein